MESQQNPMKIPWNPTKILPKTDGILKSQELHQGNGGLVLCCLEAVFGKLRHWEAGEGLACFHVKIPDRMVLWKILEEMWCEWETYRKRPWKSLSNGGFNGKMLVLPFINGDVINGYMIIQGYIMWNNGIMAILLECIRHKMVDP